MASLLHHDLTCMRQRSLGDFPEVEGFCPKAQYAHQDDEVAIVCTNQCAARG